MNSRSMPSLMSLEDAGLTVANREEDIRGRIAIDGRGHEIGEVTSLLIDEEQRKIRFLEVHSGGLGFLGLGGESRLVPVDAVTRTTDETVQVEPTREHVHGSPRYAPELARDERYYTDIYGYYGYGPFWAPGYEYPRYPPRR
jgi:sporulation protein YlmC with PRC-barrel domain